MFDCLFASLLHEERVFHGSYVVVSLSAYWQCVLV